MTLAANFNVYNTCLRILVSRGFDLEVDGEIIEEGSYPTDLMWTATKDNFCFRADNPIELLGLVAISDYTHPKEDVGYWWYVDGEDIQNKLLTKAFPEI